MSLNWDLTKIEDHDTKCWLPKDEDGEQSMNPVTESLIWSTIIVDLPGITEANAPEFWARIEIYEKTMGKILKRGFTPKDIRDHIGLSTNVHPATRKQWRKRLVEMWEREHLGRFGDRAATTFPAEPAQQEAA